MDRGKNCESVGPIPLLLGNYGYVCGGGRERRACIVRGLTTTKKEEGGSLARTTEADRFVSESCNNYKQRAMALVLLMCILLAPKCLHRQNLWAF